MTNTVSVGSRKSVVVEAVVSGAVYEEGSRWGLSIEGDSIDMGSAQLAPRIYSEDIPSWRDKSFETFADLLACPLGDIDWLSLYFSAHFSLDDARAEFSSTGDGQTRFTATGICDINWSEEIGRGVEIAVECSIGVGKITSGILEEDRARKRLQEIIRIPGDMSWSATEYAGQFEPRPKD